jgi:phage tail-like protein
MTATSGYLDHLPAALRTDDFLGQFLLAFEAVFTGLPDAEQPGLEQTIEGVVRYFDPLATPREFLPWLASWVALGVRADWDDDTTRGFLREVVSLYRLRGTAAGLQRILQIYLRPLGDDISGDGDVVVYDEFDVPEHFFQVRLRLSDNDPVRLRAVQETAQAIIELEKPAHTVYALRVVIPTMRLVSEALLKKEGKGELLVLGQNTRLGSAE